MSEVAALEDAFHATFRYLGGIGLWSAGTFFALEASPRRLHRPILLAGSVAYLLLFWHWPTVAYLCGSAGVLWAAQSLPGRYARARAPLALLFLVAVYVPLLLAGLPFDDPRGGRGPSAPAVLTCIFFFKRALSFTWERHVGRVERQAFADVLLYFVALPFLYGPSVIVAYSHFYGREDPGDALGRIRSAATTMGWVLLHVAFLVAVFAVTGSAWRLHAAKADGLAEEVARSAGLVLGVYWLVFYAARYVMDQTLVGVSRLLGHRIDDNNHQVLLSDNFAEFWRRWNIHLREFTAAVAYYPIALAVLRVVPGGRTLAVVAACAVTFAFHGVLNWITIAAMSPMPDWGPWVAALVVYEVVDGGLVAASLLVGSRLRDRWPGLAIAVGIPATFALRSLLIVLLLPRREDPLALLLAVLAAMVPGGDAG